MTIATMGEWVQMESRDIGCSIYNEMPLTPDKRELKIKSLENTVRSRDLAEAQMLATSREGLVSDKFRRELWPLLLQIPKELLSQNDDSQLSTNLPDNESIESNPSNSEISQPDTTISTELDTEETTPPSHNDSKTNTSTLYDSWKQLPPHKDEEQVAKDANRAFTYYPFQTQKERDECSENMRKQLEDVIVAVLRRNPDLSYYQGYHDIATILYLIFGPTDSIPVLEYVSLYFLRDFMTPTLDSSLEHLSMIPALLEASDAALAEVLAQANPFYAISPIITVMSHNITSFNDICVILDYLFASRNMAIPIYLYASIVEYRKSILLPLKDDLTNEVDKTLSTIIEDLPDDNSVIFDITTLTTSLLEQFPPQTLKPWKALSEFSVLKTTAAPPSIPESYDNESHVELDHEIEEESNFSTERRNSKFSILAPISTSSNKSDDCFDDVYSHHITSIDEDDHLLVLDFPKSPTFPTQRSSFYNFNNNSGSSTGSANLVHATSRRGSNVSDQLLFSLKYATSPTPDERTYEYLQVGDYFSSSFTEPEESDLIPAMESSAGSNESMFFESSTSPIRSPPSIASSVTSIFDVGAESRATTAFGSFASAKGIADTIPQAIAEEGEHDMKSEVLTADNEAADSAEIEENKLLDPTETADMKKEETNNTAVDLEKQEEVAEESGSREFFYSLQASRELLHKQVEECEKLEKIKRAEQEKRLEELRKKREEAALKRQQEKERAERLGSDTNSGRSTPSSELSRSLYNYLPMPAVPILAKFIPTIPPVGFSTTYRITENFPAVWTEGSSLISRLVSSTRTRLPSASIILSSPLASSVFSSPDDENSTDDDDNDGEANSEKRGKAVARSHKLLALLYPTTFVSVSIYVGVFGLIATWYLNRYYGNKDLNTLLVSQFRMYSHWLRAHGIYLPVNAQGLWSTMVAKYF